MSFIYDINAEERKRRKKGCLLSLLIMLGVIILGVAVFCTVQAHKVAPKTFYDELNDYAFELAENNQGANHYGEIELYKLFSNGRGVYLFESWHDSQNCYEPGCELETRCDTVSFSYMVNDNTIYFDRNFTIGINSGNTPVSIYIDEYTKKITTSKDCFPLYVVEQSTNWNEVKKMLTK